MKEYRPEPEALRLFSRALALRWRALPLAVRGDTLTLLVASHLTSNTSSEVTFITGKFVEEQVAHETELLSLIEEYFPPGAPSVENIHRDGEGYRHVDEFDSGLNNEQTENGSGTAVSLVDAIINQAISMSASDVHIEPAAEQLDVRYRVDGVLQTMQPIRGDERAAVVSRIKLMAKMDIAERRRPQDGRISMEKPDATLDIRVSSLPTPHGEKVVLRLLDKSAQIRSLSSLGMPERELELLVHYLEKPQGMILVTGPTGSGKTTTLYAALMHLLKPEVNIMTIEDPIEYEIRGITQSQVKPEINYDFANALRAFLRQDPDIIMVGEIRDRETAQIALRAAMTGHLVLSTVHTNSAAATVVRLVDLGIEPYLVASSLSLVVAQRLVRRLCPNCKLLHPAPTDMLSALRLHSAASSGDQIFARGTGCHHCGFTGYKGRVGVFELLEVSDTIRQAMRESRSADEINSLSGEKGISSLKCGAERLVLDGITTIDEMLRVVE